MFSLSPGLFLSEYHPKFLFRISRFRFLFCRNAAPPRGLRSSAPDRLSCPSGWRWRHQLSWCCWPGSLSPVTCSSLSYKYYYSLSNTYSPLMSTTIMNDHYHSDKHDDNYHYHHNDKEEHLFTFSYSNPNNSFLFNLSTIVESKVVNFLLLLRWGKKWSRLGFVYSVRNCVLMELERRFFVAVSHGL